MATIYEVATRAGVSPATVSRVFNGVSVSPALVERVRAVADELSFMPNRTARSLRRQSSEVIALIIPDIENPFFTSLARGVENRAQAAGFSVVLCNSDEQQEKEARYIDIAVSENMAGVILAPASDNTNLAALLARNTPVVAVDRRASEFDVDAVLVDNEAGGRVAAETLFDQGFSRVACITGPRDVETARQRLAGWRSVFIHRTPELEPDDYFVFSDYRVDGGRAAMTALMRRSPRPDAVFVANNLMSVGALQQLLSTGSAPPAIGMVAFGDLPFATLELTGVTVVHLPARHLGETATALLLDRIRGDDEAPRTIVVPNAIDTESTAETLGPAT